MIVELNNITKIYTDAEVPAVKNVSFGVQDGEILTLLGPSGCGKTTLLRLIAGLERPDNGEVIMQDKKMAGKNCWVPPEDRGIGMVFQDYALFPHLSVRDNISFGLKSKDKAKNAEKVQEMIELVGLENHADKNPADLSGGQQQRVALARALVTDPILVLLDEPFSNLDMNLREKMRREVVRILRKSETPAVFVTHDQEEALSISDKIVVMNNGQLEQKGTPREIYESPIACFVATFVGQSNILHGVLGPEGEKIVTDLVTFPYHYKHNKQPGEDVIISIRPDGFDLVEDGPIQGVIKEIAYKGGIVDLIIELTNKDYYEDLLVHIHPKYRVEVGDRVSFKLLPHFMTMIGECKPAI